MPMRRITCVVAVLLLGGCAGRVLTPAQPVADATPAGPVPHFAYAPTPVEPRTLRAPIRIDGDYVRTRMTFTAGPLDPDGDMALQVDHYRGSAAGPRPLVIVVPIWGNGAYRYPSAKFTQLLRAKTDGRYDILQVLGEPQLIRWQHLAAADTPDEFRRRAAAMAERVRLASIAIRRMLDWAAARDDLDADRAAVVGFSMGAVVATIVLGNDDRFAAGAVVMGGARFDRIFAHCGGRAGRVRATVSDRFGWTGEQYRAVFAEAFASGQPRNFRGRYDPHRLLMMDARFDDCVPQSARDALWEALGRPQRITFLARHRGAFLAFTPLALNYGGRSVFRFLRERLEPEAVHE